MIVDRLENCRLYECLGDKFAKAFSFLQKGDFQTDGQRHAIDGDDIYYTVQEYTPKPLEKTAFESHRVYADIQYVIAGREKIGYAPVVELKESVPYNPEKDIVKYDGQGDLTELKAGMFAVYFPQDGHRPCIAVASDDKVTKIVVKIRCG